VSDKERPPSTERAGALHDEVQQSRAFELQLSPSSPLFKNSCGGLVILNFAPNGKRLHKLICKIINTFLFSFALAPARYISTRHNCWLKIDSRRASYKFIARKLT
jgi:hypothetical protein